MSLSMLIALNTAPALMGTQEAIRQSQAQEKREEHRARRCNLIASCVHSSKRSGEINGRRVVLLNNKLYIDTGTADDSLFGHPFAGYYLPYPDSEYEGLVSTVTDEAPILNWIYIDRRTFELKYSVRADAQPNLTGPFDCTRQDRRLTFQGWEGFIAVEEKPCLWAVYFDVNDNGLKNKIRPGIRALEIELTRKEKRWKKNLAARQEDQNTMNMSDENQTMRQTNHGEAIEASQQAKSTNSIAETPPGSRLPSKGLDLRNSDLRLGPSNKNHTPRSRECSQRLANSDLKGDDDVSAFESEMSRSVFSEPAKAHSASYTPASSVRTDDHATHRQNHSTHRRQESSTSTSSSKRGEVVVRKVDAWPKADLQASCWPKVDPQLEAKSERDVRPKVKIESELKVESQSVPQSKPQVQPQPKAKRLSKVRRDSRARPDSSTAESKDSPEPKGSPEFQGKSATTPERIRSRPMSRRNTSLSGSQWSGLPVTPRKLSRALSITRAKDPETSPAQNLAESPSEPEETNRRTSGRFSRQFTRRLSSQQKRSDQGAVENDMNGTDHGKNTDNGNLGHSKSAINGDNKAKGTFRFSMDGGPRVRARSDEPDTLSGLKSALARLKTLSK